MKRAFIRALWGIYDDSNRLLARRKRMDSDMRGIKKNRFNEPFIVYVFGKDNYKHALTFGFNCVLVDENPSPFDLLTEQYRHKLEILKYAMEEDGYDEIMFVDWDCIPNKKIPVDFWDVMGKKEIIQANLQLYKRRKATWREKDMRKIPNAGFLYLRDKSLPSKIIEKWEEIHGPSAEPPLAKLTDEMTGGWQGIDKYWELFEPDFCNLHKMSVYPQEKIDTKNVCFKHFQG